PKPPVAPAGEHDEAPAWYTDPLGDGLAISGAIGIGVGVVFVVKASSSSAAAKREQFRDAFVADLDRATLQRRIGAASLAAGSALAIGGVLVFVFHRPAPHHLTAGTDGRSVFVAGEL